jgi:hypothetical protein
MSREQKGQNCVPVALRRTSAVGSGGKRKNKNKTAVRATAKIHKKKTPPKKGVVRQFFDADEKKTWNQ